MTEKDLEAFGAIMRGLCEVYGREMTPFLSRAYWETLRDLTIEEVEQAAIRYMRQPEKDCRFMPKPGDLRAMIDGTGNDTAAVAWSKVLRGMRDYGSYRSVAFDDPVIHRVIEDMGGWPAFGRTPENEMPFFEARFCRQYTAHRRMGLSSDDYPPYLSGITEMDNRIHGHLNYIEPPALIGNAQMAKQVINGARQTGQRALHHVGEVLAQIVDDTAQPALMTA